LTRPTSTPAAHGRTAPASHSTAASANEFLACEQFNTLLQVQVLAEDWRIEYNTYRPHGSLDGLTPEA